MSYSCVATSVAMLCFVDLLILCLLNCIAEITPVDEGRMLASSDLPYSDH